MTNELKLKMTVQDALEFADEWSRGMTLHEGSQGWRVVCLLLAAELRRLAAENAQLRAELEAIRPLEWALQTLVERCNNDAGLTNDDAVISAEAALERLYRSRNPIPVRKS